MRLLRQHLHARPTAMLVSLEDGMSRIMLGWLPYLLLSKRVNVTFRHRLPA